MQFVCRYGTPDGRVLTKVQDGADATSVKHELERQGFHIFEVRPRTSFFNFELPFGKKRRRMPIDEFLAFNQELAALLRAGLPLLQALELMLERIEDPHLRQVLSEIRDQVKSGVELSECLRQLWRHVSAPVCLYPQGRRAVRGAGVGDPPFHPVPAAGQHVS